MTGKQYLDLWSAALPAKPGPAPEPKPKPPSPDNVVNLAQWRAEKEQERHGV
jgi:hypothetical protein